MALLIKFLLCAALAVAAGCASSQSVVESRFAALHGCRAEKVVPTASGWIAIGCGVRAHFYCFDTDDEDYDSDEDTILGHLLFSGNDGDDVCVQEQVDVHKERVQVKDPTIVAKGADGTVRLKAFVPLLDAPRGELLFSAAPGWKVPGIGIRMVLELEQPLPETCPAQVWIDGKAEAVRSQRHGDAAVLIAITSDQLARMGQAKNLSLQACDHVATLHHGGLARVRLFASRFAETRARVFTPSTQASVR
jgi:hypothetical protein